MLERSLQASSNFFAQPSSWQRKVFSFWWTRLMWVNIFPLCPKSLEQWLHLKSFFFEWTMSMCLSKTVFRPNFNWQPSSLHENGLFFKWTSLTCLTSFLLNANFIWQPSSLHEKGFFSWWTAVIWSSRWSLLLNFFWQPSSWHEKGRFLRRTKVTWAFRRLVLPFKDLFLGWAFFTQPSLESFSSRWVLGVAFTNSLSADPFLLQSNGSWTSCRCLYCSC